MESRERAIWRLSALFFLMATIMSAGFLMLVIIQPERVGLVREGDFRETATVAERTLVVIQRTIDANLGLEARNFELVQTVAAGQTEIAATATQNADQATESAMTRDAVATAVEADLRMTADALATSGGDAVETAFANIVVQATLEFEAAVLAVDATNAANNLAATERANAAQATGAAVSAASTQAALNGTAIALDQRLQQVVFSETQSALDAVATQTQVSVANAQQATQSADSFALTGTAFAEQATRVEQDFQGTEAALNRDATAVALAFATDAPGSDTDSNEPQATQDAFPFRQDGGAVAASGDLWRLDDIGAWGIAPSGGLLARQSASYLLSQADDLRAFSLEATINPGDSGDVFVMLALPPDETLPGIAARVRRVDGGAWTITLIRFDRATLLSDQGITGNGAGVLATSGVAIPLDTDGTLDIAISYVTGRLIVQLEGVLMLDTTVDPTPAPGAAGVQVAGNMEISRITLNVQ